MDIADMTGTVVFGTLIVGLIIAIIIWARFMRNSENRHPMDGKRERYIEQIREEAGQASAMPSNPAPVSSDRQ